MRLYWLLLILLPFFGKWTEFRSEAGKFQVLAPQELQHQVDTTETAIGDLIYHTYFLQQQEKQGNQIYMVTYCDYPEGSMHADSTELVEEFFDATIQSATESVEGELLYIHKDKLQGQEGKRWRIDYLEGKAVIRTRAFVVSNRYYSVQVVNPQFKNMNANVERFMDSFRFLETE